MKIQITTSIRNARNFNDCYFDWKSLMYNFDLVDSTTMVSIRDFDEYDEECQDEMDDLEMEVREIFISNGSIEEISIEKVSFEQVY